MKKITTLHQNKWVSLLQMVWPEKKVGGYIYSHETRCNGHIISVLPFRVVLKEYEEEEWEEFEFLLRHEITPCWDIDYQTLSSITGGVERGLTPEETAVEEIEQEAGYIVEKEELISLGTCFGVKSSDTIYHLFAVDLSGREKETDAKGDGSELERLAECKWHSETEIHKAEDPFVCVNYVRLLRKVEL